MGEKIQKSERSKKENPKKKIQKQLCTGKWASQQKKKKMLHQISYKFGKR